MQYVSIPQQILLANRARTKLMDCAMVKEHNKDYDLRRMVAHANMLDSLLRDVPTSAQPQQTQRPEPQAQDSLSDQSQYDQYSDQYHEQYSDQFGTLRGSLRGSVRDSLGDSLDCDNAVEENKDDVTTTTMTTTIDENGELHTCNRVPPLYQTLRDENTPRDLRDHIIDNEREDDYGDDPRDDEENLLESGESPDEMDGCGLLAEVVYTNPVSMRYNKWQHPADTSTELYKPRYIDAYIRPLN
ncbi:hypothetical protein J7295_00622 [Nakaseomyces glabratus]|nr:hypothetical protein J7298_00621 [Nakaseomyces glabratus]KAH7607936.1 hypothetical protein J7295_00622 [Nakaseomyces glabratus]KAH7615087.1 hypothetical protein J7292_00619 [Nakaseomyces glabratus]